MRIAFFTLNAYSMLTGADSQNIGGAQLQQILVGKELAKRGHEVYFVEHDAEYKQERTVDGITVRLIDQPVGNELRRAMTVVSETISVLRELKPDVCYRRALDFEIVVLASLCQFMKPSFVYGIAHDNNLDDAPDTFGDGIKGTRLYGYLNRKAISAAESVIAQNDYQYRRAQRRLDTKVEQITNCYRPGNPDPIESLEAKSNLVVLWVARFSPFKRPERVFDLAEKLPDVQFVMVGNRSDEELYERSKSRAEPLPNVRFEGFVPFSEIDRYFATCDLFLNTSEQEGFPNTFLQAWAYGKPVVSLTVDPNAVLSENDIGWVMDDSMADTAELLSEIGDDVAQRERTGDQARHYFEARHSVEAITDEYERVFRSLS